MRISFIQFLLEKKIFSEVKKSFSVRYVKININKCIQIYVIEL